MYDKDKKEAINDAWEKTDTILSWIRAEREARRCKQLPEYDLDGLWLDVISIRDVLIKLL